MDNSFRTQFYCHQQRSTILLRHVLTLQRCRPALLSDKSILAILDVSPSGV